MVSGEEKWLSIVHNGNVINVKTKPAVTARCVTSHKDKVQTPSSYVTRRHKSLNPLSPFQRDVIYGRPP